MNITIIHFISHALGDNIAFSPYADLYQKKHGGKIFVKTKWHTILDTDNPNVEFVSLEFECAGAKVIDVRFAFQRGPLQKIICDALGLEYKEIRPKLRLNPKYSFNRKKKYVCISVQSTAQMKYWNPNGWDKIVKFVKDKGYDVYCIDKDEVFGIDGKWNYMPKGAYNETGDYPIQLRMEQIKNCEFFIGLSGGLSWVAWALNKKVVMVSGCTDEDNEFKEGCYRVINKDVCHGCLNDPTIDNINGVHTGWMYCPRNKNFECTKKISVESVKLKINNCILGVP